MPATTTINAGDHVPGDIVEIRRIAQYTGAHGSQNARFAGWEFRTPDGTLLTNVTESTGTPYNGHVYYTFEMPPDVHVVAHAIWEYHVSVTFSPATIAGVNPIGTIAVSVNGSSRSPLPTWVRRGAELDIIVEAANPIRFTGRTGATGSLTVQQDTNDSFEASVAVLGHHVELVFNVERIQVSVNIQRRVPNESGGWVNHGSYTTVTGFVGATITIEAADITGFNFENWTVPSSLDSIIQLPNVNPSSLQILDRGGTTNTITIYADFVSAERALTITNQPTGVSPNDQMPGGNFAPGFNVPLAPGTGVVMEFLGWWINGATAIPIVGATVNTGHAQFIAPSAVTFPMPLNDTTLTALWGYNGVVGQLPPFEVEVRSSATGNPIIEHAVLTQGGTTLTPITGQPGRFLVSGATVGQQLVATATGFLTTNNTHVVTGNETTPVVITLTVDPGGISPFEVEVRSSATGNALISHADLNTNGGAVITEVTPGVFLVTGAVVGEVLTATASGFATTNNTHIIAGNETTPEVILLTPIEPGVLSGFVFDATDRTTPIAGARVFANFTDGSNMRVETTTGPDGSFTFTNLPNGTYLVSASAFGFDIGVAEETVTLTNENGANVNVYLQPSIGTPLTYLLIVNVEPSAAVAAGASIEYGGWILNHVDGNTWELRFTHLWPSVDLTVSAPGFETRTKQVVNTSFFPNGIFTVTVWLDPIAPEYSLQGYVIEAGTSNRLSNATVMIVNTETGWNDYMVTNSEGFFRFEGLALGDYTVIAWSDGFNVATSPNSPVTLSSGVGTHENVYLTAGGNDYSLIVTVVGPPASAVSISMSGGTNLAQSGVTNVWTAAGTAPMVGDITVVAQFFQTALVPVVVEDYVNGVARIVIIMEEPDAIIRFHVRDANGNLLAPVDVQVELGQVISTALIPVPPTRYAAHLVPGQHFMGWFTADQLVARPGFGTPHDVRQPLANRAVAFDITQVITDQMLEDLFDENGILHLHESWLQYGDVMGLGVVDGRAVTHLRQFLNHQVDAENVIMAVGDVRKLGAPGAPVVDGRAVTQLSQFFNHQHVYLGVEPTP